MSKYPQDIFGILRGISLVASASIRSQETYLKHIWSHSSVRDAIENSAKQTSECGKKVINNPSQEFQNINHYVKESFLRSSVVLEGLRQYMSNGRTSEPIGAIEISEDSKIKSYSTIKNIKNLDIASITLKELENLLAEHNKIRQVNLKIDNNFKPKKSKADKVEQKEDPLVKIKPIVFPKIEPTASIVKDEKQVENVMKFITNYDKEPINAKETMSSSVQEVSHTFIF